MHTFFVMDCNFSGKGGLLQLILKGRCFVDEAFLFFKFLPMMNKLLAVPWFGAVTRVLCYAPSKF